MEKYLCQGSKYENVILLIKNINEHTEAEAAKVDLDVFHFGHTTTAYTLFTDAQEYLFSADGKNHHPNDTGVDNSEQGVKNMINSMKALNADIYFEDKRQVDLMIAVIRAASEKLQMERKI